MLSCKVAQTQKEVRWFKDEKKLGTGWTRRKMDKGPEVRTLGG